MRHTSFLIRTFSFVVLTLLLAATGIVQGEEIRIEEQNSVNEIQIGDFSARPCLFRLGSDPKDLCCVGSDNFAEMTAGELWEFFHDQGYSSVSELKFFVDIDKISEKSSFAVSDLSVSIEDPADPTLMLTQMSMGGHSMLVPGYETSSIKPEAQLRFDLGYDFMERFSRDSTEKVRFNYLSDDASVAPRFLLASNRSSLTREHLKAIGAFLLFWALVFFAMNRFIRPTTFDDPFRSKPTGLAG